MRPWVPGHRGPVIPLTIYDVEFAGIGGLGFHLCIPSPSPFISFRIPGPAVVLIWPKCPRSAGCRRGPALIFHTQLAPQCDQLQALISLPHHLHSRRRAFLPRLVPAQKGNQQHGRGKIDRRGPFMLLRQILQCKQLRIRKQNLCRHLRNFTPHKGQ